MPKSEDIPIGDGEAIAWISVRGREQDAALVDDLLPEATWLWQALGVYCTARCCGIQAFDLTSERIRWVAGGDVEPSTEPAGRHVEPGDAVELATQLEEAIDEIRSLDAGTVYSKAFDTPFDKRVFIELLTHVSSVLRGV